MRAVTVTEYGATPAVAEMPTPQPGPGQVLIRLRAAGMEPDGSRACLRRLAADAGDIPDGARSRWRGRGRATRAGGVELFRRRRSVRPVADRAAWLGGNVRRVRGRYRGRAAGACPRRTRRRCRGGAPDGWRRRARLGRLA